MDKITFEQWCIENNRMDLLELWDYELNAVRPSDVIYTSNKKVYFKCKKGIHKSFTRIIKNLTDKEGRTIKCKYCNSLGQYIVDKFGEDFLNQVWSDKNEKSPYEYSRMGAQKVWFKCINGFHEDFERLITNAVKSDFSCPTCSLKNNPSHQKMNLIGQKFGKLTVVLYDEEKSKEKGKNYWICKCECGNTTSACNGALRSGQRTCGDKSFHQRGENAPGWKGGSSAANKDLRKDPDYYKWRREVLRLDNYRCQCCGSKNELEVHHINSFLKNENQRFDVSNGIVLCRSHHSTRNIGSFHNIYGIRDFTPSDLEKYINEKRKEYGILIPFDINTYTKQKKLNNWLDTLNTDFEDHEWEEPLDYDNSKEDL